MQIMIILWMWHKSNSMERGIKCQGESTCSLPMATRQKRFPWLLSASSSERVTPEREDKGTVWVSAAFWISARLSGNNRHFTCWRPGFDEACAVHDHILRLALLWRTQSIPAGGEMLFTCVWDMFIQRERDALPVSASQEVESVHGHRLYRTHSTSGHRHNNAARKIFHSIVYIENTIEDFW